MAQSAPEVSVAPDAKPETGPKPEASDAPAVSASAPTSPGSPDKGDQGGVEPKEEILEPSKPEEDAFTASDKVVRRAGQDVLKNAVRDANALGAATNAAVKSAQDAADAVGEKREGDVARIEPTLGDAVIADAKTYQRKDPVAEPFADKVAPSPIDEDEADTLPFRHGCWRLDRCWAFGWKWLSPLSEYGHHCCSGLRQHRRSV